MSNPVLRPRLAIQLDTLDIDRLVAGVEIHVPNRGCFTSHGIFDTHFLEVGGRNQVDILSGNRPETHHTQHHKGAHGTAIVISGDTGDGGVEL